MAKLDLKKELRHLYNPPAGEFTIVEVPPLNFVMLDGHGGNPADNPEFAAAMEVLYGLSYTLKFTSKRQMGIDYTVMALEGLWSTAGQAGFDMADQSNWQWTVMMLQPEHLTAEMFEEARAQLARKKNPPALARARFERWTEGLSVQTMYLGAYADEGPTIARMHAFIREQGYEFNGRHHEIYLGDPRRTAPERLRTVLRQPVRAVSV
jgi:hypothetical protein